MLPYYQNLLFYFARGRTKQHDIVVHREIHICSEKLGASEVVEATRAVLKDPRVRQSSRICSHNSVHNVGCWLLAVAARTVTSIPPVHDRATASTKSLPWRTSDDVVRHVVVLSANPAGRRLGGQTLRLSPSLAHWRTGPLVLLGRGGDRVRTCAGSQACSIPSTSASGLSNHSLPRMLLKYEGGP